MVRGCGNTISPVSGSLLNAAIARSISPISWTLATTNATPSDAAATSAACRNTTWGRGPRNDERPEPAKPGSGLKEDAEPFAAHLRLKILKARDVAARSCQARDEAAIDRIGDLREDDWGRLGEPLKLCQCGIAGDYDCVRR